jgi:site-specific DNA-methyltransferase (adenine-specific)
MTLDGAAHKSLKERLQAFLSANPRTLQDIYDKFKGEKHTTIRGRLNENIGKAFERVGKGVYIATRGGSKALLIEGDSWDVVKKISSNSMDLIIADSPYTIMNEALATGTTRKKSGKWSFVTKDMNTELLIELLRVLRPGGHFFSFLPADSERTLDYNNRQIALAKRIGFTFNKRFIWDKVRIGLGYHGRSRYEQIIFFSKGKRRMPVNRATPDLLSHARVNPATRLHESEKPIELLLDLVYFGTEPGEWVLDPFAGSFNVSRAALQAGRNSIAIERDKQFVASANKRLGASPIRSVMVTRRDGVKQHYNKKVRR